MVSVILQSCWSCRPVGTGEMCHGGAGKEWQPLGSQPRPFSSYLTRAVCQRCPSAKASRSPDYNWTCLSLWKHNVWKFPLRRELGCSAQMIWEDVLWHFPLPNTHKEEKLGLTAKSEGMLRISINDFHLAVIFDECWKAVELDQLHSTKSLDAQS